MDALNTWYNAPLGLAVTPSLLARTDEVLE
jgi:hypothetical protein